MNQPLLCHFIDEVTIDPHRRQLDKLKLMKMVNRKSLSKNKILMLTRRFDPESELLQIELIKKGFDYVRINVEDLAHGNVYFAFSQSHAQIRTNKDLVSDVDISLVWFRDFEIGSILGQNTLRAKFATEQWIDALNILQTSLKCPWVNPIGAGSNKSEQLSLAEDLGFKIPPTLITNDPLQAHNFRKLHRSVIVKALHHHNIDLGNRTYSIFTHKVSPQETFENLDYAPSIIQKHIKKSSELRVTVVGDRLFATRLTSDRNHDDIHRTSVLSKKPFRLKDSDCEKSLEIIRKLGLSYGAIDFLVTNNGLIFLEITPTGNWYWIEHYTKQQITNAIVELLTKK